MLTDLLFTAPPTPTIAAVFAWVVETGSPNILQTSKAKDEEISDEKAWNFCKGTISEPTDFIIFLPPLKVPNAKITAIIIIAQFGIL